MAKVQKQNILVVGKSQHSASVVCPILRDNGYVPIQAVTLRDAKVIADQCVFALAFVELDMGAEDIVKGIKGIVQVYPNLKIIGMAGSGNANDAQRRKVQMIGIDASLRLPCNADELLDKISAQTMGFSEKPSDHKKILIIDEDEAVLRSVRKVIEDAGYRVSTARNAEEAIYNMKVSQFDLVVTEIFVSGIGGIEGIMKMRAEWPNIKIVAMSGGLGSISGDDAVIAAQKVGADYGLPKPIQNLQLVGAVSGLLN